MSNVKNSNFRTLIVIPAFNEEGCIAAVVKKLVVGAPFVDYLVVNDGSSDSTAAILIENGFNHINLPVNIGLHGAVQVGIKYAHKYNYSCVLQFDGDGQHKVEYIESLIEVIKNGSCNLAIGSRFVDRHRPNTLRMIGSRLISLAIYIITKKSVKDPTSGMRAYDRSIIELLANNPNFGPEPDTVAYLLLKELKVKEVHVEMDDRTTGTSYLGVSASIKYMMRMLTSIILIQPFR